MKTQSQVRRSPGAGDAGAESSAALRSTLGSRLEALTRELEPFAGLGGRAQRAKVDDLVEALHAILADEPGPPAAAPAPTRAELARAEEEDDRFVGDLLAPPGLD